MGSLEKTRGQAEAREVRSCQTRGGQDIQVHPCWESGQAPGLPCMSSPFLLPTGDKVPSRPVLDCSHAAVLLPESFPCPYPRAVLNPQTWQEPPRLPGPPGRTSSHETRLGSPDPCTFGIPDGCPRFVSQEAHRDTKFYPGHRDSESARSEGRSPWGATPPQETL